MGVATSTRPAAPDHIPARVVDCCAAAATWHAPAAPTDQNHHSGCVTHPEWQPNAHIDAGWASTEPGSQPDTVHAIERPRRVEPTAAHAAAAQLVTDPYTVTEPEPVAAQQGAWSGRPVPGAAQEMASQDALPPHPGAMTRATLGDRL